ncbi:MAG: hypothetical protein HC767_06370 [Akkermansiaceae bacterium]|nr:hypothetical protein [Akkermansiaceae bacterium]
MQAIKKHASKATSQEDVVHVQIPLFVNSEIHTQYVDDVAWVGELLLSKSTCNELILWRPKGNVHDAVKYNMEVSVVEGVTILRRFKYPAADLWFLHFGLHLSEGVVAVGNKNGVCYIWNLELEQGALEGHKWSGYKSMDCSGGDGVTVRCVAVISRTALLAGLDDGRVVLMQRGK